MKKSSLNFIINALMFLSMSAIVGIGFLLKYTLIPGQERRIKYGNNAELFLFGMDRHEWGAIHLIIGFVLLGLLVLHLILHWKVITCVYNRIIQRKLIKKIIALSFLLISALLIIAPLFIQPKVHLEDDKKGQHKVNYNNTTNVENKTITTYENERFK